MSLRCAISGEALTPDMTQDIVVTPSGRLCLKRLLLTKLSENGGMDPFSDAGRPLSEDELVSLQAPQKADNVPPPPSKVSSFSGTLQQLAHEYDSVLLELFDTRKALQETRRELSQALYQNDAAIRVLARVSMERDAARQESQRFQAAAAAASNGAPPPLQPENGVEDNNGHEAPRKKARVEEEVLPLTNGVPTQDLDVMLAEWEQLHKDRRAKPKTTYVLPTSWKMAEAPAWHKAACKGLTAIAEASGRWVATAGKDKSIMVYDSQEKTVGATFTPKCVVHHLDVMVKPGTEDAAVLVVAACGKEARIYDSSTQELHASCDLGDLVVGVSCHPTKKHCFTVTKGGKLMLFRIGETDMEHVSTFFQDESGESSCCGVHPDGMLVAAGYTTGTILLWDVKGRKIGATFKTDKEDAVKTIAFSSNGYAVASTHASGAVRVWDLRKSKLSAELNVSGDQVLKSVSAVAFHPDGKYLAYGGAGGLHIVMLKEWKVTAIPDVKVATGIVWDSQWLASISDKARAAKFHVGGEE